VLQLTFFILIMIALTLYKKFYPEK